MPSGRTATDQSGPPMDGAAERDDDSMNLASPLRAFERAGRFLLVELWHVGTDGASRITQLLLTALRVTFMAVEGFFRDLCLLRASALTFASLMAFVPTLALAFAVLRGLGWHGDRLEELILSRATLLSGDAIDVIVSYIDNTSFAGLGVIGGSVLLLMFVSVMTNIELSFNAIWGDVTPRTLVRRLTDYTSVLIVAPVLLAVATSLTATVRSSAGIEWLASLWGVGSFVEYAFAAGGYVAMWLLFSFLYMAIPNTRVRLVPALIGGVIGGTIWHITQWTYIRFQIGVANYNAIYGAMAQLPLLLAWLYISWVIVLFGAEISHAVQNLMSYSRERRTKKLRGQALKDRAGLGIAGELATAALGRAEAPSIETLAARFDVPQRLVREILADFASDGIVHLSDELPERAYLSITPDNVRIERLLDLLSGGRADTVELADGKEGERIRTVLAEVLDARDARLGSRTLVDLAR